MYAEFACINAEFASAKAPLAYELALLATPKDEFACINALFAYELALLATPKDALASANAPLA